MHGDTLQASTFWTKKVVLSVMKTGPSVTDLQIFTLKEGMGQNTVEEIQTPTKSPLPQEGERRPLHATITKMVNTSLLPEP